MRLMNFSVNNPQTKFEMKELEEINQTLKELCMLFDNKVEDDRRHEDSLKELDVAIAQMEANHAKLRPLQ